MVQRVVTASLLVLIGLIVWRIGGQLFGRLKGPAAGQGIAAKEEGPDGSVESDEAAGEAEFSDPIQRNPGAWREQAERFGWRTDYATARAEALADDKPLMVVLRCVP